MITTTGAQGALTRRAAIYCRISAADEGDNNGVTRQLEDCQQVAARAGRVVLPEHVFVENDTSATTYGTRKLYQKLIQLVRDGEIDMIICWAADRLLRLPRELEDLIQLAEKGRVTIMTAVTGGMDLSTTDGRVMARVNTTFAIAEIERKHDRTVRANLQRAQQGRPPQVRAFGYAPDGSTIPAEAALVREVFDRWTRRGASINAIARFLDESGAASAGRRRKKDGTAQWSRAGVRKMLINPRYVGHVYYLGERIPDAVAQWEALIDEATFTAAQVRLSDPSRESKASPAKRWLGSGVYLCGICLAVDGVERTMITNGTQTRSGVTRRGYMCSHTKHNHRSHGDDIDAHVEDIVRKAMGTEEFRARLAATSDHTTAIGELIQKRADLKAEELQLVRDLRSQFYTRDQFAWENRRNREESAAVEKRLKALSASSEDVEMASAADLVALWDRADIWKRTRIARRWFRIVVEPVQPWQSRRGFDPTTVTITTKKVPAVEAAA